MIDKAIKEFKNKFVTQTTNTHFGKIIKLNTIQEQLSKDIEEWLKQTLSQAVEENKQQLREKIKKQDSVKVNRFIHIDTLEELINE